MSRHARSEVTVEKVLTAAMESFVERGSRQVGVQEIATRAGVSIGSIYHHFGSSDGIAVALYKRSMEQLLVTVRDAALAQSGAREFLAAFVAAYLGWVETHPDEAQFIYWELPAELSPAARVSLAEFKAPLLKPLFERIAAYVAAGELAALPPAYYEIVVVGQVAELSRRWLAGAPGLDLQTGCAVLQRTTWDAVKALSTSSSSSSSKES